MLVLNEALFDTVGNWNACLRLSSLIYLEWS